MQLSGTQGSSLLPGFHNQSPYQLLKQLLRRSGKSEPSPILVTGRGINYLAPSQFHLTCKSSARPRCLEPLKPAICFRPAANAKQFWQLMTFSALLASPNFFLCGLAIRTCFPNTAILMTNPCLSLSSSHINPPDWSHVLFLHQTH